jgi:hypothetical protein
MLSGVTKSAVVLLMIAAASLCLGGEASAQQTERFGVFSVQNDTGNLTIQYQIKIGNGPWTTYTIAPGQNRVFWHEYKNQHDHSSPPTYIRFNSAVGNNQAFEIQYDLTRYAAPDHLYQYAKQYSFQKNDQNYYDLTSIN